VTTQLNEAQGALVEQEKAEYELSIAREVQKQMLPLDSTTTPFPDGGTFYAFSRVPGWAVGAYYKGAKAVSGDYFDVFDLGNGLWGMCVADVSGKGIPGSMVMAVTRTIVRLVASKHLTRANETLKETNRLIARQIKRGMFVTCYYAVLDERTGQLTYASAGHNPMVLYRAASKSYELASGKGIALGFNEGPIFDRTIEVNTTQLASGDGLVLYTDGFPEAMNDKSQEFGDERFYEAVVRHAQLENQLAIMNVVGEIAKHRGSAEQSDDLTILMATRA
jgi:sigma-B regulation protein RsbU (phosphoserine phosphatase)